MVSPLTYVREVIQELNKVSWPSRQQTIEMTTLVIVVSFLVSLYIGGLDVLFQQLMKVLIK